MEPGKHGADHIEGVEQGRFALRARRQRDVAGVFGEERSGLRSIRPCQDCDLRRVEPKINHFGDLCGGVQGPCSNRELEIVFARRCLGMQRHAGGKARLLAPVQAGVKRDLFQGQIRGALEFLSADRDCSNLLLIRASVKRAGPCP